MSIANLLPGLLVIALTACGESEAEKTTDQEHVWKGQVQTIDKARQVEDVLKERKKAQSE